MSPQSFVSSCELCRLFVLVLIVRTTHGTDLSDGVVGFHNLPRTTLKELSEFLDGDFSADSYLKDVGGHVGVFAVTNLGSDYAEAVVSFRSLAPKCLENFDSQLPVVDMADGSKRRTYATQVKF